MALEIHLVGELEDASLKNALEEAIDFVKTDFGVKEIEETLDEAQELFETRPEYVISILEMTPDEDTILEVAKDYGVSEEDLDLNSIQDDVYSGICDRIDTGLWDCTLLEQAQNDVEWEEDMGEYSPSHCRDVFKGECPQVYIRFDVPQFERWYKENDTPSSLLPNDEMFYRDIVSIVGADEECCVEDYEYVLNPLKDWCRAERAIHATYECYKKELSKMNSIISECIEHYID